jgi:hypothetical protein
VRDSARLAYAQARIQGRHGRKPDAGFWRGVDATRDFEHVIDLIRGSAYRAAALSLSAQTGIHELEQRLRREWAGACAEAAGWYPSAWQPAFLWMRWLPWLPALAWLAAGKPPHPWMHDDPLLAPLLGEDGAAAALARTELAPLAAGFEAGGSVRTAWRQHWRSLWRPLPPRHARGLERLDRAFALRLLPPGGRPAADFETVLEETGAAVERLFRRHAGTPVAGLAWLALGALDRLHLRAALSAANVLGGRQAA